MSFAFPETSIHTQSLVIGQSYEFKHAHEAEREATSHAHEPISQGGWKRGFIDKAIDIFLECSEEGWDGYEANPVTLEALEQISLLIQDLPTWAPQPNIVPTPQGEISLEWHTKSHQILSIYPKGEYLIHAASLGPMNNQFGHTPLQEKWPDGILLFLRNYF